MESAMVPHANCPVRAIQLFNSEHQAIGLVFENLSGRISVSPNRAAIREGRDDGDLGVVNVTVTDPYNRLVTGLETDNFRVFEDNIEQEVVTFSAEDVPISIGVIFDFSGSMSNKVGKAREAAVQFFKTANPQD